MQCNHKIHASCIECVPIFANLSREEMSEINEIASPRNFKKGEMVYWAGDEGGTLIILHTGRIKLFRINANGKEQVLGLISPGEFIGELSLFSSLPLTDNAQVLEDATMCVLEGEKLKKIIIKYPSIAFKIMDELSRRLERAENQIESISLNSVSNRLIQTLLDMSKEKDEIILPMTKGDLASQLGMSQETLSRKLAKLQEEGLIMLKGQKKIVITNRLQLQKSNHE